MKRPNVAIFNTVGLYAEGLEVITGPMVDAIKRLDSELVVVMNKRACHPTPNDPGWRFEIYDRAAPGGPKWQLVMRVQEPDGSFRGLDMRVLQNLVAARRPMDEILKDLEGQEADREVLRDKEIRRLAEDLFDDVKDMGKRVMGYGGNTAVWSARTDPAARERIRAEAVA